MNWWRLLVFLFISFSCDSDHSEILYIDGLVGEWELTELLVDPGDGSASFQPVNESEITLEFQENGEVVSNGLLCEFTTQPSLNDLIGQYSLLDSAIITNCDSGIIKLKFSVDDDDLFIRNTNCREPCLAKLNRI